MRIKIDWAIVLSVDTEKKKEKVMETFKKLESDTASLSSLNIFFIAAPQWKTTDSIRSAAKISKALNGDYFSTGPRLNGIAASIGR